MVVTLLICLTVLVIGVRAEPFVDRLIQIQERRRDVAPAPQANASNVSTPDPITVPVVVPDDIVARALSESEPWAQDDLILLAKEKYGKLKDWQKVRRAIGIAEMP